MENRTQTRVTWLLAATIALAASVGTAVGQHEGEMSAEQQAMMEAYIKAGTPGAPHEMLASTAGSYKLQIKSWPEPGAPPMEETGTATREMALDGRVLVEKVASSMMGMPFTGQGMSGFDNVSGKFWGIWTDSMSTGVMVSEGTCDADSNCKFSGSWNDPLTKAPVNARMISRWSNPTTQIFEMYGPGPDGKEMKMMEITYLKQ